MLMSSAFGTLMRPQRQSSNCTEVSEEGSYSFPASSDSLALLLAQPSAPAVTDSEQDPEVQQPGTRPPRCSSRPPFSNQPEERKGLREDTRGAHSQRVLVVLRAEAPGAAGLST